MTPTEREHSETTMPTKNPVNRGRALFEAFLSLFRGHTRGAAHLEYITIVGACALTGIVGFKQFGVAFNSNLEKEAQHIQGKGMPDLGTPLKPTVPYVGNPLAPFIPSQPQFPACGPRGCTRPGECFVAGTLVATETGERPIESIRVGERVWSKNLETGEIVLRPVVERFVTPAAPVIDLEIHGANGTSERLTVTPRHEFWTQDRGWAEAQTLSSTLLESPTAQLSPTGTATLSATALATSGELATVYNIEVAEHHNYFVGNARALVHNLDAQGLVCGPTTPGGGGTPPGSGGVTPPSSGPPPCPDGYTENTAKTTSKVRYCEAPCGTVGTYRELGGAGVTGPHRIETPPNHDRDHIPAKEPMQRRADQMVENLANEAIADLCVGPSSADKTKGVITSLGQASSIAKSTKMMGSIYNKIANAGLTIVIDEQLHQVGRTYGGSPAGYGNNFFTAARGDLQFYLDILTTPDAQLDELLRTRYNITDPNEIEKIRAGARSQNRTAECTEAIIAGLQDLLMEIESAGDYEDLIEGIVDTAKHRQLIDAAVRNSGKRCCNARPGESTTYTWTGSQCISP
jgi:hypothetical protein